MRRSPERATAQLRNFQALVILMRIYEDAISVAVPSGKLVVIIPASFALYAVVRIGGIIAVFAGVYAIDTILFIEIILNLIAQVFISSSDWREEMRNHVGHRNSTLAKGLRGLRDIRVRLGGLYFIDKGLVLTVLAIITQNSINILLLNQ